MISILPRPSRGSLQADPCLVDEGSSLQSMVRAFPGHFASGQPTELLVDGRQQISCGASSLFEAAKDTSDVVQGPERFQNPKESVNETPAWFAQQKIQEIEAFLRAEKVVDSPAPEAGVREGTLRPLAAIHRSVR